MRQNPHVRICGGTGSATTLVYPTSSNDGCIVARSDEVKALGVQMAQPAFQVKATARGGQPGRLTPTEMTMPLVVYP